MSYNSILGIFVTCFMYASANANTPPSVERQKQIVFLLKHDCGSCHGMKLKGGLGTPLLAKNLANKSDEFLIQTILNGRPGTAMPPWRPFLSRDEAAWLVTRLKKGLDQ